MKTLRPFLVLSRLVLPMLCLALALLASCSSAQSQWQPSWVPCDAQGNPLPSGMVDAQGFELMGGTLTGSVSGSQSVPESLAGKYYYYTDPINCFQSTGTVTQVYDPQADDDLCGIGGAAYDGLLYNEDGPNTSITSTAGGQVKVALQAYFLWQPTCDSDNPPASPPPPPPSTAQFLLRTSLVAESGAGYQHQQYDSSPDPTSGISATASVQDDVYNEQAQVTQPSPPYAYSGVNYNLEQTIPAGGLHFVTASVQMVGGKGIYTVPLTGSASAQASDSIDGTRFTGSAYAGGFLYGNAKPFNIRLVQPDPNKDATLGDVENQFVYSADTPDGYLYIPGAIQVVGGTHADAQFLLDNNLVDLKIENSPVPNTFVHQWAISGNTIYVNTPQNTDDPYPGYQFNHWIFKGLPTSFSTVADGNHNVNLYVQGTKTQTAKIQTFFDMAASNWPSSNAYDPNWFHYYQNVYIPFEPDTEPVYYSADLGSRGLTTTFYNEGSTNPSDYQYLVQVGPNAPADDAMPVFGIDAKTNFVTVIGSLNIRGIYSYIRTDSVKSFL